MTPAENIAIPVQSNVFVTQTRSVHMFFLRLSQFVTWPCAFVYFHLMYDLKVEGRDNWKKVRSPFILISNHINVSDSFLFRLVLGYWTHHLPLRFMAVRKFKWGWLNFLGKIGVIDFIYAIFGVFTVVPGLGLNKNLEEAKRLLHEGNSVVIYPEGTINKSDTILPFKPGAAALATSTGLPVIPVIFRLYRDQDSPRRLVVRVGEPVSGLRGVPQEKATEILYGRIVDLYQGN